MRRGEAGERVACRRARLNVNVTDGAAAGLTRIYDREPSVSQRACARAAVSAKEPARKRARRAPSGRAATRAVPRGAAL